MLKPVYPHNPIKKTHQLYRSLSETESNIGELLKNIDSLYVTIGGIPKKNGHFRELWDTKPQFKKV